MADPIAEDSAFAEDGAQGEAGPGGGVRAGCIGVEIRLSEGDVDFLLTLSLVGSTPGSIVWMYHLDTGDDGEYRMPSLASGRVIATDHHEARRLATPILIGCFEQGSAERRLLETLPAFSM